MYQSCGTCRHYNKVDARQALNDPDCVYMMCTWVPSQPFWMPPPYLRGPGINIAAILKPDDGAECPVYSVRP